METLDGGIKLLTAQKTESNTVTASLDTAKEKAKRAARAHYLRGKIAKGKSVKQADREWLNEYTNTVSVNTKRPIASNEDRQTTIPETVTAPAVPEVAPKEDNANGQLHSEPGIENPQESQSKQGGNGNTSAGIAASNQENANQENSKKQIPFDKLRNGVVDLMCALALKMSDEIGEKGWPTANADLIEQGYRPMCEIVVDSKLEEMKKKGVIDPVKAAKYVVAAPYAYYGVFRLVNMGNKPTESGPMNSAPVNENPNPAPTATVEPKKETVAPPNGVKQNKISLFVKQEQAKSKDGS